MKFIHSADWQIGAAFAQFGAAAGRLREARVQTLQRALEHAARVSAEAFVIAGDLFEDNEVEPATVRAVFDLFAAHERVPIFILPGNHDPCDGPRSIWQRAPFSQPPAHVVVWREPGAVEVAGAWLFANPLTQKKSAIDPSLALVPLAAAAPEGVIKIGVTHGSPAINSRSAPDDFPIALDAATRAGLDYLALGHWHSPLEFDGDRMRMPGTPEPTKFYESGAGSVLEVEIAAHGELPRVTPVAVAGLAWEAREWNADEAAARGAEFKKTLAAPQRAVVRVTLRGEATPEAAAELRHALAQELAGCCLAQIVDATKLALSAEEISELRHRHPLVAAVLDDLTALGSGAFGNSDAQALAERAAIPPQKLDAALAAAAQRVLLRELREVARAC